MEKKTNMRSPLCYDLCGIKLNIYDPKWQSREKQMPDEPHIQNKWRGTHSHFTFEVFFVAEGSLSITVEQDTRIYERKIVIIPPKLKHVSYAQERWGLCLLFAFDTQQLEKDSQLHSIVDMLSREVCTFDLSEDAAVYVRKISEKTAAGSSLAEKEAEFLIGSLFCQLLYQLLPEEPRKQPPKSDVKHINAIDAYINANRYHRITPLDIANNVYLSLRQVSRIIAKEYHCTPNQLILDRKLNAAEVLVKNTDIKISEIASMMKLGSDNYFCTLFKKRYGISPLQYRKRTSLPSSSKTKP